ncbi:hypothetical protein GBZ86_15810 [Clostridium tarantellae]|uniref:Uncharacterized protein n=2 Tax=Clostridium tarantellae TaxID=39493 RepID=A0A6I1MSP1_9CLOT|nr:hypothetical protein [Clostridium tarantellae]
MVRNRKINLKKCIIKLVISILLTLITVFLMKKIVVLNSGNIKYFMLLVAVLLVIILDIFVFTSMMYLVFTIDGLKNN